MRKSLTRKDRLRRNSDIRELFSSAAKIEGRGVKLLYRRNDRRENRFAVVIARGCGGAVRRNREKRITREAYRSLKGTISPGHDLLFFVVRFGATLTDRCASMRQLVGRAGLRGAE
ncbi:MAG: ribonuclease P protein component [Spirochaetia bacterium]|jgi:ribonuclease P protein component